MAHVPVTFVTMWHMQPVVSVNKAMLAVGFIGWRFGVNICFFSVCSQLRAPEIVF